MLCGETSLAERPAGYPAAAHWAAWPMASAMNPQGRRGLVHMVCGLASHETDDAIEKVVLEAGGARFTWTAANDAFIKKKNKLSCFVCASGHGLGMHAAAPTPD